MCNECMCVYLNMCGRASVRARACTFKCMRVFILIIYCLSDVYANMFS